MPERVRHRRLERRCHTLTIFVQLLQMVTLGEGAPIPVVSYAYMRYSHGGLSAVMKLTKMFAENVSSPLELLWSSI
jgi:hypothetical protein